MKPMYSEEWFGTFAATVPAAIVDEEVAGIASFLPLPGYRRVLDVGCGIGRTAGPLAARGYAVTGLDVNVGALRAARRSTPGARFVALDQRHTGHLRWVFDGAIVLWNSLGYVGRDVDSETLAGIAAVLRPEGKLILELYDPDWLAKNQKSGERDDRGASVRRWVERGRCFNQIRYASGLVDDIQFDVYRPDEIADLARRAGLDPVVAMAGWRAESPPDAGSPRYQVVCARAR